MQHENWQNSHHTTPVRFASNTTKTHLEKLPPLSQANIIAPNIQLPRLRLKLSPLDINILTSMHIAHINKHQQPISHSQIMLQMHKPDMNMPTKGIKPKKKQGKKPNKAKPPQKMYNKKSTRVLKLTKSNLDKRINKLTRDHVNDRIREYLKDGQEYINDGIALYPLF